MIILVRMQLTLKTVSLLLLLYYYYYIIIIIIDCLSKNTIDLENSFFFFYSKWIVLIEMKCS